MIFENGTTAFHCCEFVKDRMVDDNDKTTVRTQFMTELAVTRIYRSSPKLFSSLRTVRYSRAMRLPDNEISFECAGNQYYVDLMCY